MKHNKNFGVYHWDTFDGGTILMYEDDSFPKTIQWLIDEYGDRLTENGADRVDVVNSRGEIIEKFRVK